MFQLAVRATNNNKIKMSKKRGVVISTTENPIAKSKSATTNPLGKLPLTDQEMAGTKSGAIEPLHQQQLAESNMVSQQPPKMVNHAYYTYDDPDYNQSNQFQQNQEYVIESMHKKTEMKLAKEKRDLERKMEEKKKVLREFEKRKNRDVKRIAVKSSQPKVKNHKIKYHGQGCVPQHKCKRPFCWELEGDQDQGGGNIPKYQLNSQRLKPRPLDFNVDMFDKGFKNSPMKKKKNDIQHIPALPEARSNPTFQHSVREGVESELNSNQNVNCRRMPFRFCGVPL